VFDQASEGDVNNQFLLALLEDVMVVPVLVLQLVALLGVVLHDLDAQSIGLQGFEVLALRLFENVDEGLVGDFLELDDGLSGGFLEETVVPVAG
jgi:hypothetical protein